MNSKIIIFFARSWSMTDESTGENRTGVSIQYIMGDTLVPTSNEEALGYQVVKESISVECAGGLDAVPGIYDAEFEMKASGGKNVLHVCGLKFIAPLVAKK